MVYLQIPHYKKEKNGKRRECFTQGLQLTHVLLQYSIFNININELTILLEQSAPPGLILNDKESNVYSVQMVVLMDVVLLSPTEEWLQ